MLAVWNLSVFIPTMRTETLSCAFAEGVIRDDAWPGRPLLLTGYLVFFNIDPVFFFRK